MEDRFVKNEDSIDKPLSMDKLTEAKLQGGQEPLLSQKKYYLLSGDEVCQVKHVSVSVEPALCVRSIESSSVLEYHTGLLDLSDCDNHTRSVSTQEEESEIRQLGKMFTSSSNSGHKYGSSSKLELLVHQYFLSWRQVVRQLEKSTSSKSAGYADLIATITFLSGFNASRLLHVGPILLCFTDNMQNILKEMKDQDIRGLLGIPHKSLENYSYKQSNSNTDIYELLHKFTLDDDNFPKNNNSKSMRKISSDHNLLADYTRKYGNLFKEARSRVCQVRKRTDLWHGNVLASRDKELFPEGSFAGNVQKLMKKDLNRLGVGGNGEIVEAFYQRKHLVIKQTLLRELELSVVPKLEHKNLLPWFAIISGEKSERRPGQVLCYQIMQKMTEDLSASIRTIGGSIHDHLLTLQQDSVPKASVCQQAELMRRNTSGVFRNVLEGLQYLHEQGLVHRDIKAPNILLKKPESCTHTSVFTCDCTPHWEIKVADFDSIGQIFVLRERAEMREKLKSGYRPFLKVSATGTSGYRAPEIFEEFTTSDLHDPEYFSPASDIWALGGVGIHMVMGFCTPRKQYWFGLMMLAHRGMLQGEERDDIISRTLGLHHIREGFPGEKWKDMINFVSRPLQIDWHQRPSAKDLLQDPFIQRYNPTPGLDTVVQGTATLDTTTLYTEQQCEDQSDDRLPDNEGENRTPPADTAASQSYSGRNEDESSDPSVCEEIGGRRAGRRCPSGESVQSEDARHGPMNHRPNQQDSSDIPWQEGTGEPAGQGVPYSPEGLSG